MRRLSVLLQTAACLLIGASLWSDTVPKNELKAKTNNASDWAASIAGFIADPDFYRHFEWRQARERFQPLFGPINLNQQYATVSGGRDLNKGIVWIYSNLQQEPKGKKWWVLEIQAILSRTDANGRELYPLLRKALAERLQGPGWRITHEQDRDTFWRKGKTNRIVEVKETDYTSPELSDKGPFVVVTAAEEQGDSEDP